MSGISGIPVTVEQGCGEVVSTHNVLPLLHELRHALNALALRGQSTTIDLGSLPLSDGDMEQIEAALGKGEVFIRLDALGPSEIQETRYSGIWLVTHYNRDGDVMARLIEVCHVPTIVQVDDQDLRDALVRLGEHLADTTGNE